MSSVLELPHREHMEMMIAARERTIEEQQRRINMLRSQLKAANRHIKRLEKRIENKKAAQSC